MGFFDSLKNSISGHFDKRREDREWFEKLQKESLAEERQVFEREFRKNSKEVARVRAYKDAAKKSGLQKLRAMSRARNLSKDDIAPGSFFSKLSGYTQKNLANREKNLERTKMLRDEAKKMQEERMTKRVREREDRMAGRKSGFGTPNWAM